MARAPTPTPCSCVRSCPGSRPVLQLLRHVTPPCLQTPRPLGSPEKAWPCPATDGSLTCRLPCSPVSTIKRTRGRRQMNMYRYRSLASRVHRRCSGHSRGQGRRGQPAETEPRCPTDGCRRYTCRYCCCRDRESPPELHVRHTIDHAVDSPADYTADHPLTMMTLISLPFTRPPPCLRPLSPRTSMVVYSDGRSCRATGANEPRAVARPSRPPVRGHESCRPAEASVVQPDASRLAAPDACQSRVPSVLRARMAEASNFRPRSSVPLKGRALPKRPLPRSHQSLVQSPSCMPTQPHSGHSASHKYSRILADMMYCSSAATIRNVDTCAGRHCAGPALLRTGSCAPQSQMLSILKCLPFLPQAPHATGEPLAWCALQAPVPSTPPASSAEPEATPGG